MSLGCELVTDRLSMCFVVLLCTELSRWLWASKLLARGDEVRRATGAAIAAHASHILQYLPIRLRASCWHRLDSYVHELAELSTAVSW